MMAEGQINLKDIHGWMNEKKAGWENSKSRRLTVEDINSWTSSQMKVIWNAYWLWFAMQWKGTFKLLYIVSCDQRNIIREEMNERKFEMANKKSKHS